MLWLGCRVTPCRRPPRANWGQEGQAPTQPPLLAWLLARLTPIPTPMGILLCKVGHPAWYPLPTPSPSRQVLLGTPSPPARPPHRYDPCSATQTTVNKEKRRGWSPECLLCDNSASILSLIMSYNASRLYHTDSQLTLPRNVTLTS